MQFQDICSTISIFVFAIFASLFDFSSFWKTKNNKKSDEIKKGN